MARLFSNLVPGRGAWKGSGLYLVLAVVAFGAVVFLLFRGRSTGLPEAAAAAGDVPAASTPAPVEPAPVAETAAPSETPATQTPLSSTPGTVERPPFSSPVPAPGTLGQANPQAQTAIDEAFAQIRAQPNEVVAVRDKLNKVLQMPLSAEQREAVKSEMAKLAEGWLFGPASFPNDTLCDTYVVKRGDLLDVIGRRLKVPYEFIMQINSIPRPEALQAGRALKVIKGPFHAKVHRATFTLDLYLQDTYVRSFKVGLGKPGFETPIGLWRVQENGKLIKPTWTDPDTGRMYKASDPDYPLGSRWIALDGISGTAQGRTGFAIHGTKEPEQIGTAGSRGCIRMYNGDVVLMYNLLVPVYSQVEVLAD